MYQKLEDLKTNIREVETILGQRANAEARRVEHQAEIAEARDALTNPELSDDLFDQFTKDAQSARRKQATATRKVEDLEKAIASLIRKVEADAKELENWQMPDITATEWRKAVAQTNDNNDTQQQEDAA